MREQDYIDVMEAESAKGDQGNRDLINFCIDQVERIRNPAGAGIREQFTQVQQAAAAAKQAAGQQAPASKMPLMDAYLQRCIDRCRPKEMKGVPRHSEKATPTASVSEPGQLIIGQK